MLTVDGLFGKCVRLVICSGAVCFSLARKIFSTIFSINQNGRARFIDQSKSSISHYSHYDSRISKGTLLHFREKMNENGKCWKSMETWLTISFKWNQPTYYICIRNEFKLATEPSLTEIKNEFYKKHPEKLKLKNRRKIGCLKQGFKVL